MTIVPSDAPGHKPERSDFLRALYGNAPDELYLELRCIHPTTGAAKALWSKVGDKRSLTSAFNRATALNGQGYGVYFAPCLRQSKSGKADAAALLPALWVDLDCDDDPRQREAALNKLRAFNPLPSAVIDSGGGLHAYWLLDAPVTLDDEKRKQAAGILRGLFSALGGDPQYVKSVASVMRLPGSVNTKPERGGVVVTLVELHADRRYPLTEFAWLESQPAVERIGGLNIVTLNGNGHHPLPPRTEDYLTLGAPEGSRNAQLFAAACQLRDAGYSQAETEGQLVPRHVASGSSEREALATLHSAFSRPAREPVPSLKQQAQARVHALVSQVEGEAERKRPSTEQIVATVEACIDLNPVEWAEARQHLKAVCGEGLKIADIDRLYKDRKRTNAQHHQHEYIDTDSYLLRDGKMIYHRDSYQGTQEKTVADWSAAALYQTCQIDDEGREAHMTTLELRRGETVRTLEVQGDVFVDDVALRRFIGGNAGSQYVVRAGMSKHLVPAIVGLTPKWWTQKLSARLNERGDQEDEETETVH